MEQFNTQALAFGKSYADTFVKAQTLALEGFERIANVQLKALENGVNATVEFWSEAIEARDFESAKAFWPKGVQFAKDHAEKLYATGQEVLGVSLKTGEAIGALVKGQFESTNETFTKQVNAAVKKATK
jgi:phasin family protein